MAPVVTLSTGFEVSTEGLFSTERTKMKLNSGIWPRVRSKSPRRAVILAKDAEAELLESARQRRSRTPVRKNVLLVEEEQTRSPSPIKRGVASARHSHMGVRTADVVGYKIVTDDADDTHAEFRINVQMDRAQWTMHRRFNDFCDLHQMLVLQHPQCAHDVSLPPKRYFKRNKFDPAYLDRRGRQLDAYLREVLAHDVFSRSIAVRDFMSASWNASAVTRPPTECGAEAAGRGERGGGAGARAGGGGLMGSMTAMNPRQIKFAIFRQQSATTTMMAPAPAKAASAASSAPTSAATKPAVHLRVRQLRAQPDFESILPSVVGTPARSKDAGAFATPRDFTPPVACRTLLVCAAIDTVPKMVQDTALA